MAKLCLWCGEPGVGEEKVFHEKCALMWTEYQLSSEDKPA